MTDAELVRLVAEKVMEWELVASVDPPFQGNVFKDKDGWLHITDPNFNGVAPDVFWPLTNADHRDMVVEAMREKGWNCLSDNAERKWYVKFVRHGKVPKDSFNESKGHAVCLAAEAALDAMNG